MSAVNRGLKFAIFDMDGTLVDSMSAWFSLSHEYLAEKGVKPPESIYEIVQELSLEETAELFRSKLGITDSVQKIVADMIGAMGKKYRCNVSEKTGAREYLKKLFSAGVRMCVATATEEKLAKECLARLGMLELFEFVLSCENLKTSKCEPEIYYMCAKQFCAEPAEIAVYEDALYAVKTARKAGFYTIGFEDELSKNDKAEIMKISDYYITGWESVK